MDQQTIVALLREKKDIRFPALPETIVRIKSVVDDPDSSTADVVRALTNPSLVVRILQVANSPALGSRHVEDLSTAVNLLGRGLVKNIVVCVAVREAFSCKNLTLSNTLRSIWQHSAEVAATASYLAPRFSITPASALIAGMLHSVGSLPIVDFYERHVEDMSTLSAVLDELSDELSISVLTRWGFADTMVQSVGHAPCCAETPPLAKLIRASHYDNDHGCLSSLGLTPDDYFAALTSAERKQILQSLTQ